MVETSTHADACSVDVEALWRYAARKGIERGNASALALFLGVAPQTMSRVLTGERQAGRTLLTRLRVKFGDRAFLQIWRCRRD